MTRQETVEKYCALQTRVADFMKNEFSADCFCKDEPHYRNEGKAFEFIQSAVDEKIAGLKPKVELGTFAFMILEAIKDKEVELLEIKLETKFTKPKAALKASASTVGQQPAGCNAEDGAAPDPAGSVDNGTPAGA